MRALAFSLLTSLALAGAARAEDLVAFYRASWAGLPAAEIRLSLGESAAQYRNEIAIESTGVSRWLTKFRAEAVGEGLLAADGSAAPSRYDARYDLRKRRDSRISLRFRARDGAVIAERSAEDTSRKPPLADPYRRDVVDPISALAFIRGELRVRPRRTGDRFTVPVYDGARRFDVAVEIVAAGAPDRMIRLDLRLLAIAGFKGSTSEDGDPDDAPRPVEVVLTDDAALLPVSLRVSIAYLPLVVRFDHRCATLASCTDAAN